MIISRFAALLLPLLVSVSPVSGAEFTGNPRCGDCWCITDPADGNTCPTNTVGITDSFSTTDLLYSTFELANDPDFLKLQSASGGTCFPFSDTFGGVALSNYPESDAEQCVSPDEGEETVCAYVYDAESTTCEGRKYRIQNFPSTEDAMMSNAAILHEGACGVCSSAQDFGARIKTYGTLETDSIKCATTYTFSRDFPKLISCYEDLGFSEPCSELWAHFAATNGVKCALDCFPDATGVTKLNEDPPGCEPSKCLACQTEFRADFDRIAGIEFPKAGITERIAAKCTDFYRAIHDPCIGLEEKPDGEPLVTPESPVSTTETTGDSDASASAGNYIHTKVAALAVTLFATALVFLA